jgi:hypothetical protein
MRSYFCLTSLNEKYNDYNLNDKPFFRWIWPSHLLIQNFFQKKIFWNLHFWKYRNIFEFEYKIYGQFFRTKIVGLKTLIFALCQIQYKIFDRWSTIMLEIWDSDQILAEGQWSAKVRNWDYGLFSSSSWNFWWSIEYHNANVWYFQLLVASRPQKQLTTPKLKKYFLSLEPSLGQNFWSKELHLAQTTVPFQDLWCTKNHLRPLTAFSLQSSGDGYTAKKILAQQPFLVKASPFGISRHTLKRRGEMSLVSCWFLISCQGRWIHRNFCRR